MVAIFKMTFQTHFREGRSFILMKISSKFDPQGPSYSIGPDSCLTSGRRHTIIWAKDGLIHWFIYASLGLSELNIDRRWCKTETS